MNSGNYVAEFKFIKKPSEFINRFIKWCDYLEKYLNNAMTLNDTEIKEFNKIIFKILLASLFKFT